jgi:Ser/Thr protein kinase RdoA (MazF antagonist)
VASSLASIRNRVLPHFPVAPDAPLAPLGHGLINETFVLDAPAPGQPERRLVLQRVNPLFSPAIHENIQAVTAALTAAGMVTPALVPTGEGKLCLQLPSTSPVLASETWRLMTYVPGHSFDVLASAPEVASRQAAAAGALIARFHAALDGVSHTFLGMRAGVHDTPRHLAALDRSLAEHAGHELHSAVAPLGAEILGEASALPALPALPPRICHGDLKFNNVLFAAATPPGSERALCLIDLDTVGPQPLAFELGDAWRSWCNRSGEDQAEASLDLGVFTASLEGYQRAYGRRLSADERRALLLGPEWISLELAARFAADALNETYFGWDPGRFASRGAHNLVRARGQFSLHRAFVASRETRAQLLA